MACNLKVDELRAELEKRGLATTGIKPTLMRRLQAAISKENDQSTDPVHSAVGNGRKRERGSEDDDSHAPDKVCAVEDFRDMSVQRLREEAKKLGLSSAGTKKQLLERLPDSEKEKDAKDKDNVATSKEQEDGKKPEKIVTATKKGAAVLDQWLPDHIKTHYHVLQLGDDIYDAMLNQTNVGDNNNKFYVIQLLESDDGATFMVYNRWGRVGIKGQDKLFGPYTSRDSAMQEFVQKFYAKTKNNWDDRKDFTFFPKCYAWLEMDYSENEEAVKNKPEPEPALANQPRETKLERRIATFISLICNVSMMKQHMLEIGYNADKLPLGKLSKSTILKGYGVLKRIADVIGQTDRKLLEQLSGEFYTVIPHDFGFKKMRKKSCSLPICPSLDALVDVCMCELKQVRFKELDGKLCIMAGEFVIDTPQKLKSKLEMVEALGEIELATKLLKDEIGSEGDPLYSHYQRLNCELTPVEDDSEEYSMIARYMHNTHAKTHSGYTVEIAQIFRVSRERESESFRKFSKTGNRMLLWHGSRLTNWTGILSQGLRIAPPEAPVTGYMFGKGVYFADMFSKSANYCYASSGCTSGVLLLCEVALGDMAELLQSNYHADNLPEGKLSTKGVGKTWPDPKEAHTLEDGVVVPLGKPTKQSAANKGSLLYNEYIVYDVSQIRMRYVLQVNFNYHPT